MTRHTPAAAFDPAGAEAVSGRLAGMIDEGAVVARISIGHRTGLFDTLASLPLATSETIAERADLAERYLREWLAVIVTGRIVVYDPAERTYHLPPERAASLTRGAALGNLAVYAQHVALLGAVHDRTRLDILVNNAGITGFEGGPKAHDPEHAALEDWRQVHSTNLDGVFLGCKHGGCRGLRLL